MNGQEAGSTVVTWFGVALTQAPMTPAQFAGIVIGLLGITWNVYSVITRNRHNKFMREQAQKQDSES